MYRSTTTRASIICTMVLGLSAIAAPAFAAHESDDTEDGYSEEYGSDERAGHGSHLEIQVECDAIEATSNHKISTITVFFADGTEEEIEVDAREHSETFTNTIDHAVAESHKGWVVDEAEDCEAEPEPSESPTGSDDDEGDTDDANDDGSDDGSANDGDASTRSGSTDDGASRTGTEAERDATRDATTTAADEDSTRTAAAGEATPAGSTAATPATGSALGSSGLTVTGNAEVFGMVFHQGIKTCPSGPFKGMPYVDIKDCGDSVLGTRLAATGSGTGIFAVIGLGLVALGTVLLRMRRARI